jgi:hypothetical protein
VRAAEQLHFQPVPPRAHPQERVDQKFHRLHAIAQALVPARSRKQEVVHATHAGHRIAHAGGDAAAQDGGHDHVLVGDVELALDHMDLSRFRRIGGIGMGLASGHARTPKIASIFSFSVPTVKGFTR